MPIGVISILRPRMEGNERICGVPVLELVKQTIGIPLYTQTVLFRL